jgi:hypothetical protein
VSTWPRVQSGRTEGVRMSASDHCSASIPASSPAVDARRAASR